MVLRLRGGGGNPFDFTDVSKNLTELHKVHSISVDEAKNSPLIIQPGINFEGKCQNNKCKFYKKLQLFPSNFGIFEITNTIKKTCKACKSQVESKNMGF